CGKRCIPGLEPIHVIKGPIRAYVATDPNEKEIIVSIRGSQTLADMITDFNAKMVDLLFDDINVGKVHRGFLAASIPIINELKPILLEFKLLNPEYKVTITGHSLGAALATLIGVDLHFTSFPNEKISVYSFGEPRVGDMTFAKNLTDLSEKLNIYRITHESDPVPHLPPVRLGFIHHNDQHFVTKSNDRIFLCPFDLENDICDVKRRIVSIIPHLNILGKNQYRPDVLVAQRQKEEMERQRMIDTTNYYAESARRSEFEKSTTLAIERNNIRKRYNELKQEAESKLEERREKLRELIRQDMARWQHELEKQEMTPEQKREEMRERVRLAKERRESERQKIVEEKLAQRWRNANQELRQLNSKTIEKEVFYGRKEQVEEKKKVELLMAKEKKYYEDLWEKEREKKEEREKRDLRERYERDMRTMKELNEQIEQLRKAREESKKMQEEECKLRLQQAKLMEMEAEQEVERKQREMRKRKAELDRYNTYYQEMKQKEMEQELEFEKKIVKEIMAQHESEKKDVRLEKQMLMKETLEYLAYLKEHQQREREREIEIEKLRKEEDIKMWRKRLEVMERDKKARQKLLKEVVESRQAQIKEKLKEIEEKRMIVKIEQENLLKEIEDIQREQNEKHLMKEENQRNYHTVLQEQIKYQKSLKDREKETEDLEIELSKDAEMEYQELLAKEMQRINDRLKVL
ncbi:alpha/beta-hydrolase, partial [Rozella allomycis CSF55]